jgi:hypothetical protein
LLESPKIFYAMYGEKAHLLGSQNNALITSSSALPKVEHCFKYENEELMHSEDKNKTTIDADNLLTLRKAIQDLKTSTMTLKIAPPTDNRHLQSQAQGTPALTGTSTLQSGNTIHQLPKLESLLWACELEYQQTCVPSSSSLSSSPQSHSSPSSSDSTPSSMSAAPSPSSSPSSPFLSALPIHSTPQQQRQQQQQRASLSPFAYATWPTLVPCTTAVTEPHGTQTFAPLPSIYHVLLSPSLSTVKSKPSIDIPSTQQPVEVHCHGNQKTSFLPAESQYFHYPKFSTVNTINTVVSHRFPIGQLSSIHRNTSNNYSNNNNNLQFISLLPPPVIPTPSLATTPAKVSSLPCITSTTTPPQSGNFTAKPQNFQFPLSDIKGPHILEPNMKTAICPSFSMSSSLNLTSSLASSFSLEDVRHKSLRTERQPNENFEAKDDNSCNEIDSTCESDGNSGEDQIYKRHPHARRTVTTIEERNYLERIYRETPYPTRQQYEQIRRHLGWKSTRRVTKWFNNRRYNTKSHRIKQRN